MLHSLCHILYGQRAFSNDAYNPYRGIPSRNNTQYCPRYSPPVFKPFVLIIDETVYRHTCKDDPQDPKRNDWNILTVQFTLYNLPKLVLSAFAAAAVILSVITFGGDMIGIDTSFAQECMNFIDRILYGGPTSPAPTLPASGELKVYVIDVGQGESILITTEENSLLIDAGENDKGDEVLDFIKQLGLTELDYVLATHPDSDHIGGMDTVLENIDVPGGVFFGEMPDDLIPTTKTYEDVLDVIEEKDIPLFTAAAGDTIDLGSGAVLTVLGPVDPQAADNKNNTSLVTRLDFGESSFLFNGDQEEDMEEMLVQSGADLDCDVMTMGHHGSSTSSSQEYLDAVTPEYASISCGRGNQYGHPHDETIEKLEAMGVEYYRTDLDGNITFTSDGETISVRTEKP